MKSYNYFNDKGIKGPKPCILFGNILEEYYDINNEMDIKWKNIYGFVYGIYRGLKPILVICDPDMIKNITITNFDNFHDRLPFGNVDNEILDSSLVYSRGDKWKIIRSVILPTFSVNKMKLIFPMIRKCGKNLVDILEHQSINENEIEVDKFINGYTMQVIARCAFAVEIKIIEQKDNKFVENANNFFSVNIFKSLLWSNFPKKINNLFGINMKFGQKGCEYLIELCKQILRERKNKMVDCTKYIDYLQILIDSEVSNENNSENNVKNIKGNCHQECFGGSLGYLLRRIILNTITIKNLFIQK